MNWNEKEILITGGTGSLGKTIIKHLLTYYHPRGVRIFSRDELKQWELKQELEKINTQNIPISYLLGNVRDYNRLYRAFQGVHIVINCAAMKQVPACEYNPFEAISTNIVGAESIINAALDTNVERVMHISTDKAVYATNLYGATKTVAEKLFLHANVYRGTEYPRFSCCRYGNVIGSRGSIVPLFKKQLAEQGRVTITDPAMTRFWITLERVVDLIMCSVESMYGGEIFIPKMPSCLVLDIANAIAQEKVQYDIIGIRPGEKIHECLIAEEESDFVTKETNDHYIITKETENCIKKQRWSYSSDTNPWKVDFNYIKNMLGVI